MTVHKKMSKLSAQDKKAIIGVLVNTSGIYCPTQDIETFSTKSYRRKHKRSQNDKVLVRIQRDVPIR